MESDAEHVALAGDAAVRIKTYGVMRGTIRSHPLRKE